MRRRNQFFAALAVVLGLAACGHSTPVTVAAGGASDGSLLSGDLGPGDGDSVYLNILPPGANGNSAGGIGTPEPGSVLLYPDHYTDQATLYGDLSYAKQNLKATPCKPPVDLTQHLKASDLGCNYFKHAGLSPDTVVSTVLLTTPWGGSVGIQRDGWGVPFITGASRRDAMYGVGYAQAQDRLWLMDVVRNIGRGRTSEFLGPAPSLFQIDAGLAVTAGYSEDELTDMLNATAAKFGGASGVTLQDLDADVAGINAWIATLHGANASKIPPEYAVLKQGLPPDSFNRNDIVAASIFIQALFAVGGGAEVSNEFLLQKLDPAFNAASTQISQAACAMWRDLRHANDPDATRTISAAFHQSPASLNEACPQPLLPGVAVWDSDSYRGFAALTAGGVNQNTGFVVASAAQPAAKARKGQRATLLASTKSKDSGLRASMPGSPYELLRVALKRAGFAFPDSMSNWMAVNADRTVDGHPIGIMGPQMGYFDPNLPWEFGVRSLGGTAMDFNARGMAFGTLPYVLIGRGTDYAWSATSGDSDIIDTRVSKMCNLDGSPASRDDADGDGFPDADGYLYDQRDGAGPKCRRFYERTDSWTATPTVASVGSGGPPQPQPVKRYVMRTHYGPVFATALVNGEPVAISTQRSTFFGELDSTAPIAVVSTPIVHDAQSFQRQFNGITGTFNWLYVDQKDVGYIHSGLFPLRDPGQSPELPAWGDGRYEWQSDRNLPADFFTRYGGDVSFPGRTTPIQTGGDVQHGGYIEWKDFMSFADHPKAINPPEGFIASWNNSPTVGWYASDSRPNWGVVHRIDTEIPLFKRFIASGRKFDFANVMEIMADAGYVDLRAQKLVPLLLQIMQTGSLTADQQTVVSLMLDWLDDGSNAWIDGTPGQGAWRRDRDGDGVYDHRAAAVLMDAWYLKLMPLVTSQLQTLDPEADKPGLIACVNTVLLCRYDAPRAQGSAYEYGWYQPMVRMLQMTLNTPGHHDYQVLKCAGTGVVGDCRKAVLDALTAALAQLGGVGNMASWDGTQLPNAANKSGKTVEVYDEIDFTVLSALADPPMPWSNRPTYQQVVEVKSGR
jgi:acyl-homoserine lactone acylase PvdQ